MIHFTCANCRSLVNADEKYAGTRHTCPTCKHRVLVPVASTRQPGKRALKVASRGEIRPIRNELGLVVMASAVVLSIIFIIEWMIHPAQHIPPTPHGLLELEFAGFFFLMGMMLIGEFATLLAFLAALIRNEGGYALPGASWKHVKWVMLMIGTSALIILSLLLATGERPDGPGDRKSALELP